MSVQIQQQNVPLATVTLPDGSTVQSYITQEHRRPLDEMAKQVNLLLTQVATITAALQKAHLL